MPDCNNATPETAPDHRVVLAEKKRALMQARLLDAAMAVFAEAASGAPVIDDVIRRAEVSRGTFYRYFTSLDEVLVALGQRLSDQMTTDILALYDVLEEPWQRISVGFRVFLVRAMLDRQWAGFVIRVDAWTHRALVARYITQDLERGRAAGYLAFDRTDAATHLLMGASAHCIQAILHGVEDVNAYMDACVRMAMSSVGLAPKRCQLGVDFSLRYVQDWGTGALGLPHPQWAANLDTPQGQAFLRFRREAG
ncbi:TetR/AcrR family transcriptional regulator [Pseudomonas sp. microsymbiont 2]